MSAEIVNLPVVTRLDLDPNRVLDSVPREGLKGVIVIAEEDDGGFYFAASMASGPENLWLMEQAKMRLLQMGGAFLEKDDV